MRVVVDMNLTPAWVDYLSASGIEAQHWSTIGSPRAPDEEVLEWARSRDWVVFTNDLDFGALLAKAGALGPSVFQVRRRMSCRRQSARVSSLSCANMRPRSSLVPSWCSITARCASGCCPCARGVERMTASMGVASRGSVKGVAVLS